MHHENVSLETLDAWKRCEEVLGRPLLRMESYALVSLELGLSSLEIFCMEAILAEYSPGFALPEQLNHADLRLGDIEWYFALHMSEGVGDDGRGR